MTDTINNEARRRKWNPRGKGAFAGVLLVAVVAFLLGGHLLGGGSSPGTVDRKEAGSEVAEASTAEVWTCSMHPQIRLPKPGKCPICFMDLIPLEPGGGEELGPRQIRMSETAAQLAQIETSPVVRSFAEHEVRMVGDITYDETSEAYITAWVPGRLDRLFVDFTGVTVKKGDHMVHMYSPELIAAQEELLQAKASVAALGNTSSRILRSTADATLVAAREKLRLLGLTPKQIEEIESSGKTSDHLTIYAPVGGVVVQKNALEGMYVDTGTRIYTIADLSRLWVQFDAYESDLPWLRYGQRVEFASPSFPGEKFKAAISFIDPIVDTKTRTVHVRAVVANKGLKLKPGMFVSGFITSRLNAEGRVISDELAGKWISPMHPEIVKDGPGKCDICGMPLVPVESLGYAAPSEPRGEAPLLIPASAPLITGTRAVVYVETPDDEGPLFEGREVDLGPRAGQSYIVKAGLREGELVVTNGAFKIDSELQIQAKPSMMSPGGGAPAQPHRHTSAPASEESPEKRPAAEGNETPGEDLDVAKALDPVYGAYFEAQAALAGDDLAGAESAAEKTAHAASAVDMGVFSHAGHEKWMEALSSLRSAATEISGAGDLAAARDGFYSLSNAVIDVHDSFGHACDRPFYLVFCPMARDNAGAYWIQPDSTVSNPYYGKAMLGCGDIERELLPTPGEAK
jgi:Cu(I)/Ag(I) efflux system membrane fusion protein